MFATYISASQTAALVLLYTADQAMMHLLSNGERNPHRELCFCALGYTLSTQCLTMHRPTLQITSVRVAASISPFQSIFITLSAGGSHSICDKILPGTGSFVLDGHGLWEGRLSLPSLGLRVSVSTTAPSASSGFRTDQILNRPP